MENNFDVFSLASFPPGANDRINVEMNRMKQDMERLLTTWNIDEVRSIFIAFPGQRWLVELLQGGTMEEKYRNALRIAGLAFLSDAVHLADFEMAERLRITKLKVLSQLITRDDYFRPKKADSVKEEKPAYPMNDVALFDLLSLPPEMIDKIMQKSNYKDAQSLAITCHTVNNIYRNSSNVLLPNIVLTLDFSSGELKTIWWLEGQEKEIADSERILDKDDEKKRNQLLRNTTFLRVVTDGEFTPENFVQITSLIRRKTFKKVLVKGNVYNKNVKMMVELFDKECVGMEVNELTEENLEFPNIKTICIHDNLSTEHGNRVLAAKQFTNITCAFTHIDTFRKALQEWDNEQREIEHWVILKQFTIFQTPFGRRHRSPTSKTRGYLDFMSELCSEKMPHGEITEYIFHPTD